MSVIRKCSNKFVETDIDDEKVVMSLESGEFFALKDTGLAIWNLIDSTHDTDEIVNSLAQTYDTSSEQVEADCRSFLAELQSAGLVELD